MGTDIHFATQYRENELAQWRRAERLVPNPYASDPGEPAKKREEWDSGRNYRLFAILAGVRNGVGFAGVVTGTPVQPVAEPRGLPEDFVAEMKNECHEGTWMGGHSQSWLSLRELLDYDWTQVRACCGVVDAKTFLHWDGFRQLTGELNEPPKEYCGGVSGPKVKIVSTEEARARIHELNTQSPNPLEGYYQKSEDEMHKILGFNYVESTWTEEYAFSAGDFWRVTMPKLIKLGRAFGEENVRIVFGFDS